MTLREHLIGAWELTYYAERFGPDGPITYPHGENPTGLIMYTADGYMSAQIMTPDRPAYDKPTAAGGTEDQRATAAAGYLAYSGSYSVDELTGVIHHHVLVSLMPNWIGGTQLRHSRLAEHRLTLTAQSAAPGQIDVSPIDIALDKDRTRISPRCTRIRFTAPP
ncbi:MAG: lipocalin-like domain-containing protein [Mycobacterium sp.]